MMATFADRRHAGALLAAALIDYAGEDTIVLALPRGGVPVAFEVARRLAAPLDVFLVRKLGVPGHEELAMGAIASGGARVLNDAVIAELGIREDTIEAVTERERAELARRERAYRGERRLPGLVGRTIILIDDGLATGATMRAAIAGLRTLGPRRIVVAVPVAAPESLTRVAAEADALVVVTAPSPFYGVGLWYDNFAQTGDDEVRRLLAAAAREQPPSAAEEAAFGS